MSDFICNPLDLNLDCTVEVVDATPEDGGQANITIISPLNYNTLNGVESVQIIVSDGNGGSDSQQVEITVTPVNDAPVVNDIITSTNEDIERDITFDGNDVDEGDVDILIYTIVTQPLNGLVVNNNDGTATYTPDPGFNGENSFTYRAEDATDLSEDPDASQRPSGEKSRS